VDSVAKSGLQPPLVLVATPLVAFVLWLLQQRLQQGWTGRLAYARLRALCAHHHASIKRYRLLNDARSLVELTTGRLSAVVDAEITLHRRVGAHREDAFRACVVDFEQNLLRLRRVLDDPRHRRSDVLAVATALDRSLDRIRSYINDDRPFLESRTLSDAVGPKAAVKEAAFLAGGLGLPLLVPYLLGFQVPRPAIFVAWALGIGLAAFNLFRWWKRGFAPLSTRRQMKNAMWTSAIIAMLVVAATVGVGWYEARLLSPLTWRGNAFWYTFAAYGFIYGELLTCAFVYLRLILVRFARAKRVARILEAEGDDGACKLRVPLTNVAELRACGCTGFDCMRLMGGVSGLLFYA